ncbi:MAG: hypothetical protein AB1505_30390 [Candidatus Latescibacterota bacterium]
MTKREGTALGLCAALLAGMLWAGRADAAAFTWGGDFRLRQCNIEDVHLRNGGNIQVLSFFRIKPALWGQYSPSAKLALYLRVTDEMRKWVQPENRTGMYAYKYPDEVVVENLYVDLKGLAGGKLDLRLGRQNLIYGTGKILLDGTPGDGSRTIYMDALRASYRASDRMTVDLLGIYNLAENPLVTGDEERNLTNLTLQDVDNEMNELGAGVYLKHKGLSDAYPFEAYYLFKQQAEYATAAGDRDAANLNTIGGRVMPKLGSTLAGNLELAYQLGSMGDVDLSGYMLDAKVTHSCPRLAARKGQASLGLYVLSGDDPDTQDKGEAWNAPFARWPQYSELYIYSYAADRGSVADWQNLLMPYVEIGANVGPAVNSTALLGYMRAMQDDGPGDGQGRGLLFTLWNKFEVAKGMVRQSDALTGHFLIELAKPGDYYVAEATSMFLRWQLNYQF